MFGIHSVVFEEETKLCEIMVKLSCACDINLGHLSFQTSRCTYLAKYFFLKPEIYCTLKNRCFSKCEQIIFGLKYPPKGIPDYAQAINLTKGQEQPRKCTAKLFLKSHPCKKI